MMSWNQLRTNAADPSALSDPQLRLTDAFLEGYICWREECLAVQDAYERWAQVGTPDRGMAFAAYRAAIDREEQAARMFHACTEQIAEATA